MAMNYSQIRISMNLAKRNMTKALSNVGKRTINKTKEVSSIVELPSRPRIATAKEKTMRKFSIKITNMIGISRSRGGLMLVKWPYRIFFAPLE